MQVIHRRDDYGIPAENFNRDWSDYKNGFGDPSKEFWLGNENIYMLTNNDDYMLRVELEDFDGNKRYKKIIVGTTNVYISSCYILVNIIIKYLFVKYRPTGKLFNA